MTKKKQSVTGEKSTQLLSVEPTKNKPAGKVKVAKKEKQLITEVTEALDVIFISTTQIFPDPDQPRRDFNEDKNMELAESVKEYGILQPIMVRSDGDGKYIVVYGHRRLWAAKKNGMSTIPAQVISDFISKDAIKAIQLIENIQRSDMHPMEEAAAFKELLNGHNSIDEISAKIGKSVYYVRQRIRLNNLTDDWSKAYKIGHLNHKDAVQIAEFAGEEQSALYEDEYNGYKDEKFKLQFFHLNQHQCNLTDAPFSLEDEFQGLPKCINCQYNSGVSSLFPTEGEKTYCKNMACFKQKAQIVIDQKIQEIKEDPGAIILAESFRISNQDLQQWQKEGTEVFDAEDFEEITAPDPDDYDLEESGDGRETKEAYAEDLQEYQDKINSPTTIKALIVNGSDKGKIIYGAIEENSTPLGIPEPEDPVNETTKALSFEKQEILRIQQREIRGKELDGEKVWSKIALLIGPKQNKEILFNLEPLSQDELFAAAKAIENKVHWEHQNWIKDYIGKIEPTITELGLRGLLRLFICDVLIGNDGSHLQKGSNNQIAYQVLKAYFPEKITIYESEQKEIAEKRQQRVEKRLKALEDECTQVE